MFQIRHLLCISALLLIFVSACKKDKVDNPPDDNPNDTTTIIPPYVQTTPWHKWIWGHWVWEDESTQQSAQQLADDYLAHGIPVGAIIIDSPWETGYNTNIPDGSLYPDMKSMVDYFHNKNIRVVFWITGCLNTDVQPLYDSIAGLNYFMKKNSSATSPGVVSWWKGDGSLIDLFNPAAVNWWKSMTDTVLALGIDGWKCDGTDYYALPLFNSSYSPGKPGTVQRLEYSHAYYRFYYNYTREKLGNDRIIFSRPIDNYGLGAGGDVVAFTPKDIGFACWVGDQDATFDGMKAALNNMYHSYQYCYLSFGSDIGGYREDNNNPPQMRSKELFIRWAQMGAFSPIMENGGGGEHRPWMFDQQTLEIYRQLVLMRQKMINYLDETAKTCFANGTSMMQFFNMTDYSYKLGEDIFVTPITSTNHTVTVNFPPGSDKWVYVFNKTQIYDGGSSATLTFDIAQFPLYVKKGSLMEVKLNP
jgi:alpha-glucosidase (family GH31 glycosyl hydrolase)